MKIEKNSVVSIHYRLTDPKGKVIDTSEGREPLVYMHGVGGLIPGLEKTLEGKAKGDHFNAVIDPADGYGYREERLVQRVMRSKFGKNANVQLGMRFQAQTPQGNMGVFHVTKIEGDEVTVDGNHPLAGVALHFDVTVADVRQATGEELEHGHAHGPGGHHHH